MKRIIISSIKLADRLFSYCYLKFFPERNSLSIFGFHGIFRNEKEMALNLVDPQWRITIQHLRQFVEYYLQHDYTFLSSDDILKGLDKNKKYILITFDDGYFNNTHALSILNEYEIPAVFFISSNYVKYNKCFCWDIIYRERKKSGAPLKNILREQQQLKSKTNEEIEKYTIEIFGERAFKPISDIDRPFSPAELRSFSKEKYVFLGNHTSDHAMLTSYSPERMRLQILNAQNDIYDITGIMPLVIAYPYGSYSSEVIRISKEVGLKLGVTVSPRKNYLPVDLKHDSAMQLGRFTFLANDEFTKQCEDLRSETIIYSKIFRLLKK